MQTEITIRGFLVGPIRWPAGAECFKDFSYDLTREDYRFADHTAHDRVGSLRDHMLRVTSDGDFQSAGIAHGELTVTIRKPGRSRSRTWPLSAFPSIADMLHDDPDWFPDYGDED